MDPDATLERIRELLEEPIRGASEEDELAELMTNLDQWLSRGGFLPKPWLEGQRTVRERLFL